jgi:hypothetical protein
MTDADAAQASPPAAMPFYKSRILQGLAATLAGLAIRFGVAHGLDLKSYGVTQDMLSDAIYPLEIAGIAWATHARIFQTAAPALTAWKTAAPATNTPKGAPPQ